MIVNGRSMEFGIDLKGALIVRAPGKSAGLMGWLEDWLHLVPKYGYVGVTSFGLPVCSDGMNSQGLSTGALWLPGSEYQASDTKATNVFCGFFVDWLLGSEPRWRRSGRRWKAVRFGSSATNGLQRLGRCISRFTTPPATASSSNSWVVSR